MLPVKDHPVFKKFYKSCVLKKKEEISIFQLPYGKPGFPYLDGPVKNHPVFESSRINCNYKRSNLLKRDISIFQLPYGKPGDW